MKEFEKYVGYCMYAFALCVVMEIAKVFVNLSNGKSAFYLFDLSYLFSPDNNLFLLYWAGAIGVFGGAWLESGKNSEDDDKGIYTSKTLEQKQADEWFGRIDQSPKPKKPIDEKRSFTSMRWINPKTGSVTTNDRYRCGFIPHESWYKDNQISKNLVERYMSIREMENFDVVYAHQSRFILEFKKWVRETKPTINNKHGKHIFKDVTKIPKSEITLSMFDFFRHHHYNEFEAKQGIDLKTSKLEIIEIYELYKAYLLLNHNIKVNDSNE